MALPTGRNWQILQRFLEKRKPTKIYYCSKSLISKQKIYSVSFFRWRCYSNRFSIDYSRCWFIVYNNFPWCSPTNEQRQKIEQTAQGILDARALYPNCSLADLYDEIAMPLELRKAHLFNDKAVMQAYGFSIKDTTEESCVAELMKIYQQMTS